MKKQFGCRRAAHALPRVVERMSTWLFCAFLAAPLVAQDTPAAARLVLETPLPQEALERGLYFALVPVASPWHEPSFELVARSLDEMTFEVAPGRYRWVAGTPGFQIQYGEAVSLEPRGEKRLVFDSPELVPLRGKVLDPQGLPVEGVRAGHLRAFLPQFLGRLSERGERLLEPNHLATTDARGRFSLPALPNARHLVLLEADGYSPASLKDVLATAEDETIHQIELATGASLTLRLDGVTKRPRQRIQLVGDDSNFLHSLDLRSADLIWQRDLRPQVTWTSLPPGRYRILLMGPRWGNHRHPPSLLAEIQLPRQTRREIAVTLPPPITTPAPAPGKTLGLLLEASATELEDLSVDRWTATSRETVEHDLRPVSGGTLVRVEGGCQAGSTFVLSTERYFGAVTPDASCESAIRLWDRGRIGGRIQTPPTTEVPSRGWLRFESCATRGLAHEQMVELPVAVGRDGSFSSAAPKGDCLCIEFRAQDYAPWVEHRQTVPNGRALDLGLGELRWGGSLVVRVVSGEDQWPANLARVEVIPSDALSESLRSLQRGASWAPVASATTDEEGWARLFGLPPGSATLRLVEADGTAFVSEPISIQAGEETILDPLEIPSPGQLLITIDPSDYLESNATSWLVTANRSSSEALSELSQQQELEPHDLTHRLELQHGRWQVDAKARLQDGRYHVVGHRDVVLEPGERVELEIRADRKRATGRVTLLGEPVTGSIDLRPLSGDSPPLRTSLDEDGRFEVPVLRGGPWAARVFVAPLRAVAEIASVELEPGVEREIVLPAGRITGRVVDATGVPLTGALVEATAPVEESAEGHRRRGGLKTGDRTDENGRFQLELLSAGTWSVFARSRGRSSSPTQIQLGSDEHRDLGELEISPEEQLTVVVSRTDAAPPDGVTVVVRVRAEGGAVQGFVGQTDTEGRAFFALADRFGQTGEILVVPPDNGPVDAWRVRLEPEIPLSLAAVPGALEVRLPAPVSGQKIFLLSSDNVRIPLSVAGRLDDDRAFFPALAPGRWSFQIEDPSSGVDRAVEIRSGVTTRLSLDRE